jgi:hypothetical protein
MSFSFTADEYGRSRIVLTNEPEFIVPLQIAPFSIEKNLLSGNWLCISMSVWSSSDIRAGYQAIEQIKLYNGMISLGLRPFDYPEENYTWIPNCQSDQPLNNSVVISEEQNGSLQVTISGRPNASPVWVGISNAKLIGVRYGLLTESEIEDFISKIIKCQ